MQELPRSIMPFPSLRPFSIALGLVAAFAASGCSNQSASDQSTAAPSAAPAYKLDAHTGLPIYPASDLDPHWMATKTNQRYITHDSVAKAKAWYESVLPSFHERYDGGHFPVYYVEKTPQSSDVMIYKEDGATEIELMKQS